MPLSPIDLIYWSKRKSITDLLRKPTTERAIFEYISLDRQYTFNTVLQEYTNPEKAYDLYKTPSLTNGAFGWSSNYGDDPRFDMILKLISQNNYMFDFNFFGYTFNKNTDGSKIQGTHYLDTLHRVVKDKLLLWLYEQPSNTTLSFNTNNEDGLGNARKKVFKYLIDKYVDENQVDVYEDGFDFNITKK
jgi:hypothetical protein